jgi:hypothetical protein
MGVLLTPGVLKRGLIVRYGIRQVASQVSDGSEREERPAGIWQFLA